VADETEKETEFWETVNEKEGVARRWIRGGWLVKVQKVMSVQMDVPDKHFVGQMHRQSVPLNLAIGLTFVPDPNREWKL
jgi:hypothetical protein